MPLIMQLERHLTNQGIIFISTPLIMLFFGQSPEQSTLCISGASLCPIIWLFLLLGASGHGGSKRKIPQPARPKCAPFVSLQNPTYRCQDAGRYVGRSLGFSFHMVGGRHWKWILDEQLFSVAASPWWSASGWSFILAWNCRVANLKDSVSSRTESR